MDVYGRDLSSASQQSNQDDIDVRKGPWTVEEDALLMEYVSIHGEGRWNSVAQSSGLKRTGKSCRLRWLNYLRPDVRRGNITLQEQLLILDLHSRWGNRWSKIAQHLPGRTDNEIKNYWRTRVQKQAKQLKCDVNSKQFRDEMRYVWMPRLMERIQAESDSSSSPSSSPPAQPVSTTTPMISSNTSTTYPGEANNTSTCESGSADLVDPVISLMAENNTTSCESVVEELLAEDWDGILNFEGGMWSDVNIWELL